MKAKGFAYSAPLAAVGDPTWARSTQASRREIAVADTDVSCKRATGLVATWSTAEKTVQLATIAAHHSDFAQFRQARDAELRTARQAIENG